jgi:hypothetical protein
MLRIRVIVQEINGIGQKTIWNKVVPMKDEDQAIQDYRELSRNTQEIGEIHAMRFKDGAGGGCQVEGSFMGAKISEIENGHEVELTFAGDRYRVW